MRVFYLLLFQLVCFVQAQAQEVIKSYHGGIFNPVLLQHGQNKFFVNPAAIGEKEDRIFTTAISANNTANGYSSTITYEIPFANRKHAIAIQVNNYRNGVYRNMEMRNYINSSNIYLSTFDMKGINMFEPSILYSRTLYFGAEGKLNLGAQAVFKRFNFIPDSEREPTSVSYGLYLMDNPIYKPDLHIGAQYRWRNAYFGASVKNLFEPSFYQTHYQMFYDNNRDPEGFTLTYFTAKQYITAFFTAGNVFNLSEKTKLNTSLLVATDAGNMYANNFDLNNTFVINKNVSVGFSVKDPSMYNEEMYYKYGGYEFIGKRSFNFNNFTINAGYTFSNVDVGFAFNGQQYLNGNWNLSAGEGYLKIRI